MISFKNHIKTCVLLAALMGLFVLVGSQWGTGGMIIALLLGGGTNLFAWFFSDTLALKSMQARPLSEQNAPELVAMVRRLSENAGIPTPRLYLCPHDAPNAFATGRSPAKGAVAVTQGLLRLMDQREVEGVIAHELAHIKNRDTLISCIAATVAGVLAFIAQWFFFMGGGRREGGHPLLGFVVVIMAAVGAAIIQSMISRTREFGADEVGAQIAGSPDGLMSALQKLDGFARRIPLVQPNPAQNNLFIIEPFSGGARSLVNLFATHPPTEQRVAALARLRGRI